MRIFHLCAGAPSGGAETAFVDTCIAMHRAGIDVIAICRPHATMTDKLSAGGVSFFTLPFGGIFDFKTRATLKELIKDYKPAIVQTWMNRAAQHCPRPSPSLPPFKLVARLGGYYKLKYYRGVSHFVTNTPDIKKYLLGKGIAPERVTPINNLVTLDQTVPPLNRETLNTPPDAFVFLVLARLHPVKGIDDFINALAKVPENAYGWIAGDGAEREKLETLTKQLGISHRLRFLGWREDKEALLGATNALVVPSHSEPFGNSFAQGWAAGCPLITTASQGPIQFVQSGTDALMVPIADSDALAHAMTELIQDKNLGTRLAAEGFKRYEEEFTPRACVTAYRDLYETLNKQNT